MKRRRFHLLFSIMFATLGLLGAFLPRGAGAAEIVVPTDFATIQAAITAAQAGDTVVVAPGTYRETLRLKNGVDLRGKETARTFLDLSNASGPIVTVSSSVSTTISSFTVLNASVGISVASNASSVVNITNNVFQLGSAGTGVTVTSSPGVSIVNNTFYGNGTAVSRDADIIIMNNIFTNNGTAIDPAGLDTNITYNAFFNNTTDGPTGTNAVTGTDPLFVDPAKHDFHLMENSPCIDATDPLADLLDGIDSTLADIGAYGGPDADPTPFPAQGLTVVAATSTSIKLSWQPNNSYLVTSSSISGGYLVHYGYAPGDYHGTDASGGTLPSPIDAGPDTTLTLLDLAPPLSLNPATPTILELIPGNSSLRVVWSSVANATGYKVHYGALSPGEHSLDVGAMTSFPISGLTNGQSYKVAVSAYAPTIYYVAVSVYDNTPSANESALSVEVPATLTRLMESGWSDVLTDYPDALAPYPALPNKGGCFIATSAYGSDKAPEVLVLRAFRDRWLLTNGAGRAFVRLYYRSSPAVAAYLDRHPAYKPVVRAALLPVVATAGLLTDASGMVLAGVLLLPGALAVFLLKRKGSIGRRGVR